MHRCTGCMLPIAKDASKHIKKGELPWHYRCYFEAHPEREENIIFLEQKLKAFMERKVA